MAEETPSIRASASKRGNKSIKRGNKGEGSLGLHEVVGVEGLRGLVETEGFPEAAVDAEA